MIRLFFLREPLRQHLAEGKKTQIFIRAVKSRIRLNPLTRYKIVVV